MLVKFKEENQQPKAISYARYELSVIEKRLMYLVINQMKTGFNVNKTLFDDNVFYIPVSALHENNYEWIKKAANKLVTRTISFEDEEKKQYRVFTAFNEFQYDGERGMIALTINKSAMPYFMELKEGYDQYQLKAALSLSSFYSQRLYEMLSGYKDTGKWYTSVERLRELLNVKDKYTKMSMFRKRVLDAARDEINKKTELTWKYEFHKTGRKFTHITFYINHKPKNDNFKGLEDVSVKTEKQVRAKKILGKMGVNKKKYQKAILEDPKKLKEFYQWLYNYKQNKENISNPAGHMLVSLNLAGEK